MGLAGCGPSKLDWLGLVVWLKHKLVSLSEYCDQRQDRSSYMGRQTAATLHSSSCRAARSGPSTTHLHRLLPCRGPSTARLCALPLLLQPKGLPLALARLLLLLLALPLPLACPWLLLRCCC